MLKFERLRIIENLLNENGSVSTSELSKMFDVTEETVRNDLVELQNANKIKRVRGGAFLIEPVDNEVPITIRTEMLQDEKNRIAQIALEYIHPGDTIAIDSSTTAISLAKLIKEAQLSVTVITNSIINGSILMDSKNVNLIILGGTLRGKSNSLVGNITNESIGKYVINKAFVSCSGLSMPAGPSDTNEQEAKIRESIFLSSEKNFLLADNTKFDFRTVYLISDFESIDCIITNQNVSKEWSNFLAEKKIELRY
ncbi:DeoR/GlpR family DNA-binding transcription regulator [Candidatus Enterococcus murrayae]|uniref:DeoR/GlpR transcriptional regulator n=1 Tax=Candidatus Enterococcus murrayae TaxID=2815321 RepID=A0ABS3HE90_9ENTE|nr:DeoR/GlpR family DNA-binding transcription regulator [Enterococcus sp. MJM16]MBO0451538.1 DeoR/GlpR transcriptional regulator [Enterococcus sp. MJM16]